MDIKEYRRKYKDNDANPGWDSIDHAFKKIYGDQEPKHWAPVIHHMLGGEDPLDGISLYKSFSGSIEHFHFVTYGFSQLYYDEEAFGSDYSKFGFELTFRLKPFESDDEYPTWVINLLQNIARYVFSSGKWFEEFHYMNANGPIRLDTDTAITALAFCIDPELGVIETPHGEVQFLQMFGITSNEYEQLKTKGINAESLFQKHKASNPLFITDLNRKNS
jgi:hypothetical protein